MKSKFKTNQTSKKRVIPFKTGCAIGKRCEDRPQLYRVARRRAGQDCLHFTPEGAEYYGKWFAYYGCHMAQRLPLAEFHKYLGQINLMREVFDEQLVESIPDMQERLETEKHTPDEQARMRAFIAGDWERYFVTPEELEKARTRSGRSGKRKLRAAVGT